MKLNGKIVVVTGGGSGIGQELVIALLARGARVAAVDLRMDGLKETETRANAGDRLSLHEANIADREAVMALPDEIETAHGAIDALINNAGIIQPFEDFNDLGFDVIDRVVDVNFGGPINMTKAFLPRLMARPEAHLVNVASMGAFIPFPGQTMYSATKAGLVGLTKNAAHAHRWDRIRINGLNIGWTETEGEADIQKRFHGADDSWIDDANASVPMGKLGQPDEIADFVVFLLSERSGVVTGSVIDWDQIVMGGID